MDRTEFHRLYLDAARHKLRDKPVTTAAETHYHPRPECPTFDYKFDRPTEQTGHMKLRLWVEAVGSDDMDVFVAIQKLNRDGVPVPFVSSATYQDGPVALGWLRASHRELDVTRSRTEQPFHPHTREQRLSPGERVALEIEIWPASIRFLGREKLRLLIQGRALPKRGLPNAPFARRQATRDAGLHVIHAGGMYDSHLLIPVIP